MKSPILDWIPLLMFTCLEKFKNHYFFYNFSTDKLVYYYDIFDLICILLLPEDKKKSHKKAQWATYAKM